jgi:hypothetical protein
MQGHALTLLFFVTENPVSTFQAMIPGSHSHDDVPEEHNDEGAD